MDVIIGVGFLLLLADAVFAWGLLAGRSGTIKSHRVAWRAGFAGLVTLPVWFLGVIGSARQFLFMDPWSVSSLLFLATSVVLLVAFTFVAFAFVVGD